MDASDFSVQLDLASSGLIQTIEDQLLQSGAGNMHIKAELYKLNVYGNIPCVSPCRRLLTLLYSSRQGIVLQGTQGYA